MLKAKIMRPAIAMIELIFAIVILGIILMSAPMLISTATKSAYVAVQQEAINEAASQVNMVMGYQWDERDVDQTYIAPILGVSSSDADLVKSGNTGRRLGTPPESYRTFVRSDGIELSASAIGTDTGESGDHDEDDMDDFSGDTSLVEIEDAGSVDYIENNATVNISTAISYISDEADYNTNSFNFSPDFTSAGSTTNSTNIKRITVTLTSSGPEELAKNIVFYGFSCNIGEYKLEEKDVN